MRSRMCLKAFRERQTIYGYMKLNINGKPICVPEKENNCTCFIEDP